VNFAALKFEAWQPVSKNNEPVPSSNMMDRITIQSRLAHVLMHKSKEEMIAIFEHPGMDLDAVDELMAGLLDTAERLKEMAEIVDAAHSRLMIAGAAFARSVSVG
jgi:hypothetical protein